MVFVVKGPTGKYWGTCSVQWSNVPGSQGHEKRGTVSGVSTNEQWTDRILEVLSSCIDGVGGSVGITSRVEDRMSFTSYLHKSHFVTEVTVRPLSQNPTLSSRRETTH